MFNEALQITPNLSALLYYYFSENYKLFLTFKTDRNNCLIPNSSTSQTDKATPVEEIAPQKDALLKCYLQNDPKFD